MLINLFIGLSHCYLIRFAIDCEQAGARQDLTGHSVLGVCLHSGLRSLADRLLKDVDGRVCADRWSPSRAIHYMIIALHKSNARRNKNGVSRYRQLLRLRCMHAANITREIASR